MMIHEQMLSPFLDLLELAVAAKRVWQQESMTDWSPSQAVS